MNNSFFDFWRFESIPSINKFIENGDICFFDKHQSQMLWSILISEEYDHLFKLKKDFFYEVVEELLDFNDAQSTKKVFSNFSIEVGENTKIFLFFSSMSACILPMRVLCDFWNELFLPSDETTVAISAHSNMVLFSYEERFFCAKIKYYQPSQLESTK
jgi:hypothetical protein